MTKVDTIQTLLTPDELTKFATGIAALRTRYDLSVREMAAVCGGNAAGISRATTDRLCNNTLNAAYATKLRPTILSSLEIFLRRKGKTDAEIINELNTLTTGEDYMPAITPRTVLPLDVQAHFGLRRDPFTAQPRRREEVFTNPALDRIVGAVEDAINYQGFLAVIGEIGSGKSLLKQRVMETVENSDGRMKLLFPEFFEMERVQSGGITNFMLESFNQKPRRNLVAARKQLLDLLTHLHDQDIRVALAFDECHHLADNVLSALKNFWELGSGGYTRYLGVVMFGQPLFKGRLSDYRFREIAERLDLVEMPALGKTAWDYVAHRLKSAGVTPELIFERKAVELLAAQASTPLALGNLCNSALVKAHRLDENKVLAAFITDKANDEPRVRSMRKVS